MTTELLVLTAAEIEGLLDLDAVHASQVRAFEGLGSGRAELAPKVSVPGREGASLLTYTARSTTEAPGVVKVIGFQPQNPANGLDPVQGVVLVMDPDTGQPVALLDGPALTTPRTAAGSAVAVDHLARPDAVTLTVIGTGVQARAHIRALLRVRGFERIHLVGRTAQGAQKLADELRDALAEVEFHPLAVTDEAAVAEAVAASQVVVACTTSSTPVVPAAAVQPGTLVVSVGSFAPDRSELPAELLGRADLVVVDDVATQLAQAGCIIDAVGVGTLGEDDLVPLGAVVTGRHPGRAREGDVVVYNSVGIAVQDATIAEAVLERARAQGIGTIVPL